MDVFAWLTKKGVRQWVVPLTLDQFRERHQRDELLGIYAGEWMIGSVIVAEETIPYYGEPYASTPRWWMHTLNIDRKCAGEGVGPIIVEKVCEHVRRQRGRDLWLHCVDDPNFAGVMPNYYAAQRFKEIMRTPVAYPSGNTFPMVLMMRFL